MVKKEQPPIADESPFVNTSSAMQFLQRVERLAEEKKALSEDIAEVWKEAKSQGHDVKALRKAYAIQKLDRKDRQALGAYVEAMDLFA